VEDLARASMARLSYTQLVIVASAGLALLLGVTGIYGVLSCLVSQRTREIGIRMAMGAGASRVRAMVVKRAAATEAAPPAPAQGAHARTLAELQRWLRNVPRIKRAEVRA